VLANTGKQNQLIEALRRPLRAAGRRGEAAVMSDAELADAICTRQRARAGCDCGEHFAARPRCQPSWLFTLG